MAVLPDFWVTGIAKVLVGEQPCLLEPWLKSRGGIEKRQRDGAQLTAWKVRHTEMLQAESERLKAAGWRVSLERYMKLTGHTATLSGKPDLIAQKKDCRPKIVDLKGGAEKDYYIVQVQIYMVAIPIVWNAPAMIFGGEVVYPERRVAVTQTSAEQLKPRLFALLRTLATGPRPEPQPSESACRFCDITEADCPQRWQATPDVLTSEF